MSFAVHLLDTQSPSISCGIYLPQDSFSDFSRDSFIISSRISLRNTTRTISRIPLGVYLLILSRIPLRVSFSSQPSFVYGLVQKDPFTDASRGVIQGFPTGLFFLEFLPGFLSRFLPVFFFSYFIRGSFRNSYFGILLSSVEITSETPPKVPLLSSPKIPSGTPLAVFKPGFLPLIFFRGFS